MEAETNEDKKRHARTHHQVVVDLSRAEDNPLNLWVGLSRIDFGISLRNQPKKSGLGFHIFKGGARFLMPEERLWGCNNQRLAEVAVQLSSQHVEVVGRSGRVHHLESVRRGKRSAWRWIEGGGGRVFRTFWRSESSKERRRHRHSTHTHTITAQSGKAWTDLHVAVGDLVFGVAVRVDRLIVVTHLEEALEATRRVLGAHPFVPVRQQQHKASLSLPFFLT